MEEMMAMTKVETLDIPEFSHKNRVLSTTKHTWATFATKKAPQSTREPETCTGSSSRWEMDRGENEANDKFTETENRTAVQSQARVGSAI